MPIPKTHRMKMRNRPLLQLLRRELHRIDGPSDAESVLDDCMSDDDRSPPRVGPTGMTSLATSGLPHLSIVPIDCLELAFAPSRWAFAETRTAEVAAHFGDRRRRTPELWNGRVLLMNRYQLNARTLKGSFFETDYANFIAWYDWGYPDASVVVCFAMAALRSVDGAFLLGVMGAHTAGVGRIYFPSGLPDPDDVFGGTVDLQANVMREVAEETGLAGVDLAVAPNWHAVRSGQHLALMKVMQSDATADVLRARILRYLASEVQPELSDVRIVRGPDEVAPQVPDYVTAFLAHCWGTRT
jgi:hypothetical protein